MSTVEEKVVWGIMLFRMGNIVMFCFQDKLNKNKETVFEIVAKASDGQRYPLPLSLCLVVCDSERGSGPEGANDVGF